MKFLIYAATVTLMLSSLVPTAQARELMHNANAKVTHLGNSAAIPSTARFQGATHKFEVHVQSKALSELAIDLPEGINIREEIEVKNQLGQKIDAKVSVNDRKATVVFSQPVPPETSLSINMRGVNTQGHSHTWMYRIYGKTVDLNAEIPLGIARIQTYGR